MCALVSARARVLVLRVTRAARCGTPALRGCAGARSLSSRALLLEHCWQAGTGGESASGTMLEHG